MESAPPVSLDAITKSFPGVIANDAISLTFLAGEIHVLLGENGAGKSTLMAILAGMQRPDSGEIQVRGKAVEIASPRESLDLGIGTVFQHVLLVPSLTVLENLMLGGPWWARQDRAKCLERFCELRDLLAVEIDPDVAVQRLSLGQQQQVEIMRALWRGAEVLILDEPTSMLTPQGVRELGQVMRRLREKARQSFPADESQNPEVLQTLTYVGSGGVRFFVTISPDPSASPSGSTSTSTTLLRTKTFKDWNRHEQGRVAINMVVLCKSRREGDLGCNQSKGSKLFVPRDRGLAFTRADQDRNCVPLSERPFVWSQPG